SRTASSAPISSWPRTTCSSRRTPTRVPRATRSHDRERSLLAGDHPARLAVRAGQTVGRAGERVAVAAVGGIARLAVQLLRIDLARSAAARVDVPVAAGRDLGRHVRIDARVVVAELAADGPAACIRLARGGG